MREPPAGRGSSVLKRSTSSSGSSGGDGSSSPEESRKNSVRRIVSTPSRDGVRGSPIVAACVAGEVAVARELLEADPTLVSAQASWTDTSLPLHFAARAGHTALVSLLLEFGADANTSNAKGITALLCAAEGNHADTAEVLILQGSADVNTRSQAGATPLLSACRLGSVPLAEMLLENGADSNTCTKSGYSPIHRSAQEGYMELTELLVAHGADTSAQTASGRTPAQLAEQGGFDLIASFLDGACPLHRASSLGHTSAVERLVKRRPSSAVSNATLRSEDASGESPLHRAARNGHLETVEALVRLGAPLTKTNAEGMTALDVAQRSGGPNSAAMSRMLLALNNPLTTRGGTGDALDAALCDTSSVTAIEWYAIPLPGAAGQLGGQHSLIVVTCGSGGRYVYEKAETLRVFQNGVQNGVFVSLWSNVSVNIDVAPLHRASGASIRPSSSLPGGRLDPPTLHSVAVALGRYDVSSCNCHHMAQALFNFSVYEKHAVKTVPNNMLSKLAAVMQQSVPPAARGEGGFSASAGSRSSASTSAWSQLSSLANKVGSLQSHIASLPKTPPTTDAQAVDFMRVSLQTWDVLNMDEAASLGVKASVASATEEEKAQVEARSAQLGVAIAGSVADLDARLNTEEASDSATEDARTVHWAATRGRDSTASELTGWAADLQALKKLLDEGVLDDEDYKCGKRDILSRLKPKVDASRKSAAEMAAAAAAAAERYAGGGDSKSSGVCGRLTSLLTKLCERWLLLILLPILLGYSAPSLSKPKIVRMDSVRVLSGLHVTVIFDSPFVFDSSFGEFPIGRWGESLISLETVKIQYAPDASMTSDIKTVTQPVTACKRVSSNEMMRFECSVTLSEADRVLYLEEERVLYFGVETKFRLHGFLKVSLRSGLSNPTLVAGKQQALTNSEAGESRRPVNP